MKKMLLAVSYGPVLAGLLAIGSSGFTGCKKKEDDVPPAPSAPPAPAPTPTPVVIAPEEDAGIPEILDAAPDVKKVVGKAPSADVMGLKACCTALQQNAQSLDPSTKGYALAAANACQQFVAALQAGSTTKAGALGSLSAMTKNLPPACR
jgi:hypothetical protein